jgi:hypothetical protein
MKVWEIEDDDDMPIEAFPGHIGSTWDGELLPGSKLSILKSFDWDKYLRLVDDAGDGHRRLQIKLKSGNREIEIENTGDIADILDLLPAIKAYHIPLPADAGMGSGPISVITLADHATAENLEDNVSALSRALKEDFALLASRFIITL